MENNMQWLLGGIAVGAGVMTLFDGGVTFLIHAGLGAVAGSAYYSAVTPADDKEKPDHVREWDKMQATVAAALAAMAVFINPIIGGVIAIVGGAVHRYRIAVGHNKPEKIQA